MNPLTDTRARVAAALAAVNVTLHDQPPAAIAPPCIVIAPGSPWIASRGHVSWDITAFANQAGGNGSALTRLEDLTYQIREALFAAGLVPDDTNTPTATLDPGTVASTTPVTLRTTCR